MDEHPRHSMVPHDISPQEAYSLALLSVIIAVIGFAVLMLVLL